MWWVSFDCISAKDRLLFIGIEMDSILCPSCMAEVETVVHIFTECSSLVVIWDRIIICWGLEVPCSISFHSIIHWSDLVWFTSGQRKVFEAVVFTCFWILWNFINSLIFGTTSPWRLAIFYYVVDMSYFWTTIRSRKAKINWVDWLRNPTLTCIYMQLFF